MIHVENLTKYYNEVCAVDNISFDIRSKEILGLLGPNGAGKTTSLRMLTGFLTPTSGSIKVKGFDIREDSLKIRKFMGYLPESAPLYREMLVYDYLDFVAGIRELSGERNRLQIKHLAEICDITSVMHKPIGELSKGFKQRVGLAHAMMNDPEILVLDEPTSGLDPNQIVEIREIIKQIGKEKTVILSTHILSEAEATCDRVVIINNGKIVADGETETLKQSAGTEKTICITLENADAESVQKEFKTVDNVRSIKVAEQSPGFLDVKIMLPSSIDIRSQIYQKIKQKDWGLLEFYQETRSLEKIFRELTINS
jgi:ABC-2 type transport system ATP-binding protein